jgi:hypothetical protein
MLAAFERKDEPPALAQAARNAGREIEAAARPISNVSPKEKAEPIGWALPIPYRRS